MIRWPYVNGIYHIYPRSFYDINQDGVGDLKGVAAKLDYLKGAPDSLGIDAVWLSPFYTSPMRDFGYDVSNYRDVDPLFGNLQDFDELVAEAHRRDIAVMIDLVPSHTSSDHPWFQEALQNPDSDKRDYYIFRPGKEKDGPPNNWLSVFGGSAWAREDDSEDAEYYCHSFLAEQPDLDWQNPAVQEEMKDIIRFWLDRGVDGIRVDAIGWMGKDPELRDDAINPEYRQGDDPYHQVMHDRSQYTDVLDGYLRTITGVVREYSNRIIIFEDHMDSRLPQSNQLERIYNIDPEVSAPFNFLAMRTPFTATDFGEMITNYQADLPARARAFYCFSNHDESRVASRFGPGAARMLSVLQLMLPGVPVVYYGQELGMTDAKIAEYQTKDPFELRVPGKGLGRDPQRTPMQWNSDWQAGFSESEQTWLPLHEDYVSVNAATQQHANESMFHLYRKLLELRKQHGVLRDQVYQTVEIDEPLFMFTRKNNLEEFLVVLNFSQSEQVLPSMLLADYQFVLSAQSEDYGDDSVVIAALDAIVFMRSLV